MAFKEPPTPIDPDAVDSDHGHRGKRGKELAGRGEKKKRYHLEPQIDDRRKSSSAEGQDGKRSESPSRHAEGKRPLGVEIDVRFLAISLVAIQVVAAAAYVWHEVRVDRLADSYRARADAHIAKSEWADAARMLSQYVKFVPDDVESRILLATTFDKSAKTVRQRYLATTYYQHALGLAPNQVDLLRRLVSLLMQLGGHPLAEQHCEQLLSLNPRDPIARRAMAFCTLKKHASDQGRDITTAQVIHQFNRALEVLPKDIELSLQLAKLYREDLNQSSDEVRARLADGVVNRMVEAQPDSSKAHLSRFRYRQQHGLADDYEDLDAALQLDPSNFDALLAAGERAFSQDRNQKAVEHFRAAMDQDGSDARGYLGLSLVLVDDGKLDAALDVLENGLVKAGPHEVELHGRRADLLISLGRYDEARKSVQLLERVARGLTASVSRQRRTRIRGLTAFLQAKLAIASGDVVGSIEKLRERVAALNAGSELGDAVDDEYRARMRLGWAYRFLAQWDAAAAEFEVAATLAPDAAEPRGAAADAWREAGLPKRAAQFYQMAIDRDPNRVEYRLGLCQSMLEQSSGVGTGTQDWSRLQELVTQLNNRYPRRVEVGILEAKLAVVKGDTTSAVQRLAKLTKGGDPRVLRVLTRLVTRVSDQSLLSDIAEAAEGAGDSVDAWLLRAAINQSRDEPDAAKKQLAKAWSEAKRLERPRVAEQLAEWGRRFGRVSEVQGLLSSAAGRESGSLPILQTSAELARKAGDWEAVERLEKKLRKLEGERGSTWRYYRGSRLVATADSPDSPQLVEAEQLAAQLVGLRPSWFASHLLLGQSAEKKGRIAEAAEAYQRAVSLGERRLDAYQNLVSLLYRQNRFVTASAFLAHLQKHIAASRSLSSLALNLAAEQGELDRAVEIALEGVKRRPNDPIAQVWLATAQSLAGNDDQAEVTYYRAADLAPSDARVWNALLSFYVRKNDLDSAKKTLHKLVEETRQSGAQKDFVLAQGYETMGDAPLAETHYRQAVAAAPGDVEIQRRAAHYFLAVDTTEAEECYRRALGVDPRDGESRRALALLLGARGGAAAWGEAMQLLEVQPQGGKQAVVEQRLRAVLLMRRGGKQDLAEAAKILQRVVEQDGRGFADDYLILARIYEQQGRRRAAQAALQRLVGRQSPKPSHLVACIDFFLRNDRPKDAGVWIDALEKAEPDSRRTARLKCRYYSMIGREEMAAKVIASLAEREIAASASRQQRAAAHRVCGELYQQVGLLEEAEKQIRSYCELDLRGVGPLARLLAATGRRTEAIQECVSRYQSTPHPAAAMAACETLIGADAAQYRTLLSAGVEQLLKDARLRSPKHEGLLLRLALLNHMHADAQQAERLYRELLAVNARHPLALNNLATLLGEMVYERLHLKANQTADSGASIGKFVTLVDAQGLVDRAAESTGWSRQLRDTQAFLWIVDGETRKAIEALSDMVALPQPDPRHRFHLALAYERENNRAEATEQLNLARAAGLEDQLLTPVQRQLLKRLSEELGQGLASKEAAL